MAVHEASLYAKLLGDGWERLAAPVRRLHGGGTTEASGDMTVERGAGLWARLLGRLLGVPPAGPHRVTLAVRVEGDRERWKRRFGEHLLVTEQRHVDGLLGERFGPIELRFSLAEREGALCFDQRGGYFVLGPVAWRLPAFMSPRVEARARACEEGVAVDVALFAPLAGRLVRYRGMIAPT